MSRFTLGKVIVAQAADGTLKRAGKTVQEFLKRHEEGDWGDDTSLGDFNEYVLKRRLTERLTSFYRLGGDEGIMVSTNKRRTATTVEWSNPNQKGD